MKEATFQMKNLSILVALGGMLAATGTAFATGSYGGQWGKHGGYEKAICVTDINLISANTNTEEPGIQGNAVTIEQALDRCLNSGPLVENGETPVTDQRWSGDKLCEPGTPSVEFIKATKRILELGEECGNPEFHGGNNVCDENAQANETALCLCFTVKAKCNVVKDERYPF